MKGVLFPEGNQLLDEWAQGLGLPKRRADLAMFDQAASQVAKQSFAMGLVALKFYGFASMSHRSG